MFAIIEEFDVLLAAGAGLDCDAFVATATAIALIVDLARMPVYFATAGDQLAAMPTLIGIMTAGLLAGTIFGKKVLQRIPEAVFYRIVRVLVLGLGMFMLVRAL